MRNQWGYTTGFLHRSTDGGRTWQSTRVESEAIKPKASNHTTRNVLEIWCHHLKQHGGESLVCGLGSLEVTLCSAAVQDNYSQLMNYLRSNLHRMDYPVYIQNGWQIGSGKVESSCKSIVGTRLKGPGMRWRPFGTTALCRLRALFKSETKLWTNYWHSFART